MSIGGMMMPLDSSAEPQDKSAKGTSHTPGTLPKSSPNIILMICDDLGSADLGCYGSKLNTPNLDRMASEGARLTRYNTPHALCSASRSALLTGRYATRTGTKPVYYPESTDGLNLDERTLANLLHENDYRSLCVGKWHLGSTPQYLPTKRGFDSYFGVPYSVDMRPLPMIEGSQAIEENTDRELLTPRYTAKAIQFIESPSPEPFFLYLAYSYPHIPINASPRFKGKSKNGIYGDAVEEIDWSVGEILATLKRNHLDKNTLVMFTSDHGPWYQGSPGVLRGRKGTTYEGGCRVPFLARWTDVIPAGRVIDGRATHLDILPTVASVCGAGFPSKPLDGISISDLLTGRRESIEHPATLYFSALTGGLVLQCIRQDGWKLRISQNTQNIYLNGTPPGDDLMLAEPELFDLDNDPAESYDVARNHPDVVKQLLQKIDEAIPTFPENVVEAYRKLQGKPASPTTPQGAAARPASYVATPYHFDGTPN
jgi:arylsulfatase